MTDRPAVQRRLDRETGSASAIVHLESVAGSGRWRLALAALAVTAATALLPIALRAQDATGGERPAPKGRVVVEHSTGDLELPPPAASPVRSGRSVRLSGIVSDTLDGTSVGGARVELLGTRVSARSTDDGRFHLAPVAPGRYSVRVTRIGYQPVTIEDVKFPEDVEGAPLSVVMRRGSVALSEVIVTPGHFGLLQTGVTGGQSLSRETLETIPQLGEDIYRAVSRLPGVSADDFSAKFSVRGGSGDELYVSLDGLELVEPFHLKDVGGAFSIIDIQTLGTASLSTGGFSAEYGDRLTGVFTLKTSDPRTDGVHGSVGVSAMNARATMQGGFAGGKGGWLVSARPGYLDVALKFTEIADSIQPRYYDLFAKAQYDLPRGGRLAMHVLRAGDSFRFLKKDEPNIFSNYGSSYGWLTWDNAMIGGRLRMQTVASAGALAWQRHGENYATTGAQTAEIDDSRSLDRVGFRQDWTFDATPRLMFKWGADAKRESATYDYFMLMGSLRAVDAGTWQKESVST
jgi:hypothetical protein